jgi:hypothetical protein
MAASKILMLDSKVMMMVSKITSVSFRT